MTLENKKIELHYHKVKVARMELEYKIEQRLEEINRLKESVKVQTEEEDRLLGLLKE